MQFPMGLDLPQVALVSLSRGSKLIFTTDRGFDEILSNGKSLGDSTLPSLCEEKRLPQNRQQPALSQLINLNLCHTDNHPHNQPSKHGHHDASHPSKPEDNGQKKEREGFNGIDN